VEITGIQVDGTYALWSGANAKTDANSSFYLKHNGDAKFAGRIRAAQLEGAVFDAIPINVDGVGQSNPSTTNWVTVGDRIVEIPEILRRPRRPFAAVSCMSFGVNAFAAELRLQIRIQNDNGTYPTTWETVSQMSVNTDPNPSAAPLSGGSSSIGNRGFQIRVQFRAIANQGTPQTNNYAGFFMGMPAGNGVTVIQESTATTVSTVASNPNILIPPNFTDGWAIA